MAAVTKIGSLKSVAAFRTHLDTLGVRLGVDDQLETGATSPLRQNLRWGKRVIGNRWAVHPMEGWDGTATGGTTEPMLRRWQRFGESGAKLIWGGEAMAVSAAGRANPNQLILNHENAAGVAQLRAALFAIHRERHGTTDDLICGYQLTHSGRFCRPHRKDRWEPKVAYRHPLLDGRFHVTSDDQVITDQEIAGLIEDYVGAAVIAAETGADFVDIKHCHGYLLHEFLSARTRPGNYGGSFENRTRLLREITAAIRVAVPALQIGVRLSAFDLVPFKAAASHDGKTGVGTPEDYSPHLPYHYAFGVKAANPTEFDLTETRTFLGLLSDLGIDLVNLTAGSPYYNPHIQRPAAYPPSDGYQPHEDPLISVARQIAVVAELKADFPQLLIVGSGYSYLQEYLAHVAQHQVRQNHVDIVGLGRMILSYPAFLSDATSGTRLEARLICRTFSDCTTAPRNGLPSGCYPLDPYYKNSPDAGRLKQIKSTAAP